MKGNNSKEKNRMHQKQSLDEKSFYLLPRNVPPFSDDAPEWQGLLQEAFKVSCSNDNRVPLIPLRDAFCVKIKAKYLFLSDT
ncbi:hypothetical protein V6N13_120252 [Hibiscus sabdariffa]|uniref:Uncharacterized protein n=1 Tax=Hibiscus sabdariffa TaxID=183260 RepID=A0ABR2E5H6_9ROSI